MDEADDDALLLVGEGDFSFSVALQRHFPDVDITTSCLLTEAVLYARHINSRANIDTLKEKGVTILFEVDATSLATHSKLQKKKFSKVLFNFPHVGGKSDIRRNRRLLKEFFCSAAKVIHPNGSVCVTLCKGQGGTPMDQPIRLWADSWQVVAMATYADLVLRKVEEFDAGIYSVYSATGYRSQDRHFRTDGALTYIFRKSPPVQMPSMPFKRQMAEITADGAKYLTESDIAHKFNMNLLGQPGHPMSALKEKLAATLARTFASVKDIGPLPLVVRQKCCKSPMVATETNPKDVDSAGGWQENRRNYYPTSVCGCRDDGTSKDGHSVDCRRTQGPVGDQDDCYLIQQAESPSCTQQGESQGLYRSALRTSLLQYDDHILGCDAFHQGELCTANGVVFRRAPIDPSRSAVQHQFIGITKENGSFDDFCGSILRSLDMLFSDDNVKVTLCRPDKGDTAIECVVEFVINASYVSANTMLSSPCNQVPEMGKPDKMLAQSESANVSRPLGHIQKLGAHPNSAFAFVLSLDTIAQVKYDLMDTRVLWCEVPHRESNEGRTQPSFPPSLFPPMWRHDLAFWENDEEPFDELRLHEIIREVTDDAIKNVILMNIWTDPSTGKTSRCYREIYQSSVHAVSHDVAHSLQNAVRLTVAKEMNVELR